MSFHPVGLRLRRTLGRRMQQGSSPFQIDIVAGNHSEDFSGIKQVAPGNGNNKSRCEKVGSGHDPRNDRLGCLAVLHGDRRALGVSRRCQVKQDYKCFERQNSNEEFGKDVGTDCFQFFHYVNAVEGNQSQISQNCRRKEWLKMSTLPHRISRVEQKRKQLLQLDGNGSSSTDLSIEKTSHVVGIGRYLRNGTETALLRFPSLVVAEEGLRICKCQKRFIWISTNISSGRKGIAESIDKQKS
mmetsp:Transcript_8330/g.17275  ORF Transcript_8330/g.17275 Transcript_8330/m.17275 type:complete len:242 (+) Transcript_8330:372-1097(+)